MKRSMVLSVLVCMFICHLAQGQLEQEIIDRYNDFRTTNGEEYAYLKTDKKIYFVGNQMKFSLAIFDQFITPTEMSAIAYIDMVHESGSYQKRYVFRLKDGVKNGILRVPLDAPSGNYQLVGYTNFMRNFQLEDFEHRQSIYVQNFGDDPSLVVKKVVSETKPELRSTNSEIEIQTNHTPTKIFFEITAKTNASNLYVVSEGLSGIQMVGKIKLKRNKASFSLDRSKIRGSFQRVIFLTEHLEVVAARAFYLAQSATVSDKTGSEGGSIEFAADNLRFSDIHTFRDSGFIEVDSLTLLKKTFQWFYRLPNHQVQDFAFPVDELVVDSMLAIQSKYSMNYWQELMSDLVSDNPLKIYPEKNLTIRGEVKTSEVLKGAKPTIHFFLNDLDFELPIDKDGRITSVIGWPIVSDVFYTRLIDSKGDKIEGEYSISIDRFEFPNYNDHVEYYNKQMTNSFILEKKEFNYMISTFNEIEEGQRFFWEHKEVDRVFETSDYAGIENFEVFVREALADVSVAKNNKRKVIKVFNTFTGLFSEPDLVIVDNYILNNSEPLFDIPIDEVKNVRIAYSEEKLERFGSIFRGGVVIVTTKNGYDVNDENLSEQVGIVDGFKNEPYQNQVERVFENSSSIELKTVFGDKIVINQSTAHGNYAVNFEALTNDGTYIQRSRKFNIK